MASVSISSHSEQEEESPVSVEDNSEVLDLSTKRTATTSSAPTPSLPYSVSSHSWQQSLATVSSSSVSWLNSGINNLGSTNGSAPPMQMTNRADGKFPYSGESIYSYSNDETHDSQRELKSREQTTKKNRRNSEMAATIDYSSSFPLPQLQEDSSVSINNTGAIPTLRTFPFNSSTAAATLHPFVGAFPTSGLPTDLTEAPSSATIHRDYRTAASTAAATAFPYLHHFQQQQHQRRRRKTRGPAVGGENSPFFPQTESREEGGGDSRGTDDDCSGESTGRTGLCNGDRSHSEEKDLAYRERRRKNNEAAKRSRDARRMKEEEIAIRAAVLEQENLQLKAELAMMKAESAKLHYLLYNRIDTQR